MRQKDIKINRCLKKMIKRHLLFIECKVDKDLALLSYIYIYYMILLNYLFYLSLDYLLTMNSQEKFNYLVNMLN